ncbi:MAG: hypothetical protein RR869_08915 [Lachnospiraceae bacterium]
MKRKKNRMRNDDGHTMLVALGFMIILFALAASILLIASYRYQKVYVRIARNQLYLYSTELEKQCNPSIEDGKLNKDIGGAIYNISQVGNTELEKYGKRYKFKYNLVDGAGVDRTLKNEFNNHELEVKMFMTYYPSTPGETIPPPSTPTETDVIAKDCIKVGDRLKVEYRIRENEIEYRITATYYCTKDATLNADGTKVDLPTGTVKDEQMKWTRYQYTGDFYTK